MLAGALGYRPGPLMAELGTPGPGRVILTGHVPDDALDALFRGASAFVYPSLSEGFGLPVLDAMARGIPCVVSATSSLPEVAGDAAVFVDPTSTTGLFDALSRVVNDEELAARLAEAGRAACRWILVAANGGSDARRLPFGPGDPDDHEEVDDDAWRRSFRSMRIQMTNASPPAAPWRRRPRTAIGW